MSGSVPSVRGLSLSSWLQAFAALYGQARLDALRGRVSDELNARIAAGLDPRGWYPVAWFGELLELGCEISGDGEATVERVARASANSEFTGVHRVLVLFMSPQRLLRVAGRVFARYYSHGRVTTSAHGPTGALVRWSGCVGWDVRLWRDCFTATTVLIESCGAKSVTAELQAGGGDGHDGATVLFRWH